MRHNKFSRKIFVFLVLLLVASVLIFCFGKTVLIRAGNFLAPEGNGKADVDTDKKRGFVFESITCGNYW